MFRFKRNCQTVFQNMCVILYFYQVCMTVPVISHPCQYLILSFLFILVITGVVEWFLFASPGCKWWWSIFLYIYCPFIYILESTQVIYPFLLYCLFSSHQIVRVLIYSGHKSFVMFMCCRYFLLVWLAFSFWEVGFVFWRVEGFKF